jgi:hypothetical protein
VTTTRIPASRNTSALHFESRSQIIVNREHPSLKLIEIVQPCRQGDVEPGFKVRRGRTQTRKLEMIPRVVCGLSCRLRPGSDDELVSSAVASVQVFGARLSREPSRPPPVVRAPPWSAVVLAKGGQPVDSLNAPLPAWHQGPRGRRRGHRQSRRRSAARCGRPATGWRRGVSRRPPCPP